MRLKTNTAIRDAFQQATQYNTVIILFLFNIDKQGCNDALCHTVSCMFLEGIQDALAIFFIRYSRRIGLSLDIRTHKMADTYAFLITTATNGKLHCNGALFILQGTHIR